MKTDNFRLILTLIFFAIFPFIVLLPFVEFSIIIQVFLAIALPFAYVASLLIPLLFIRIKKIKKWLNKDNNKESLFISFLLLITLGIFNGFSKMFWNWGNRPSYEFGKIELWLAPLGFIWGAIFLIGLIFLELKISKNPKIIKRFLEDETIKNKKKLKRK